MRKKTDAEWGQDMLEAVKGFVARTLSPIVSRVSVLEARTIVLVAIAARGGGPATEKAIDMAEISARELLVRLDAQASRIEALERRLG